MSERRLPIHNVSYFVGNSTLQITPLRPFDDLVIDFLDQISQRLLKSEAAVKFSDIATFAFWCRRGHLSRLKSERADEELRLGRGLAFHITPANVPINFAYSFAFGLLSGNSNLVRIPSAKFPQIEIVCDLVNEVLRDPRFEEIRLMTAFVRYDSDSDFTEKISAISDIRMIWGGDQTIKAIRAQAAPARSIDVTFSDRTSLCVMNSNALGELTERDLGKLARGFYNDTYLLDQNACSSPHLILWEGEASEKSIEMFWRAVENEVNESYKLDPFEAVHKYTQVCRDAIQLKEASRFSHLGSGVYRIRLQELPPNLDDLRGQFGTFYEFQATRLGTLSSRLSQKFQTLTYFGVPKEKLSELIVVGRALGIDRIVPVGQALDMNLLWDGYDMIRTLSRVIDVR